MGKAGAAGAASLLKRLRQIKKITECSGASSLLEKIRPMQLHPVSSTSVGPKSARIIMNPDDAKEYRLEEKLRDELRAKIASLAEEEAGSDKYVQLASEAIVLATVAQTTILASSIFGPLREKGWKETMDLAWNKVSGETSLAQKVLDSQIDSQIAKIQALVDRL